ncbi:MAG: hypothetical protein R3B92_02115 [Patescibacteria group bacterium]
MASALLALNLTTTQPQINNSPFGLSGNADVAIKMGLPWSYTWMPTAQSIEHLKSNKINTFIVVGHIMDGVPTHKYDKNTGNPINTTVPFSEIAKIASKPENKGMYWAIGNEPDQRIFFTPYEYAEYYKKYTDEILKYDNTAKISFGGLALPKYPYSTYETNNKKTNYKTFIRNGKVYVYVNGKLTNKEGILLDSIHRYREGPCKDQKEGQCKFDTKNVTYINKDLVETITVNGKYWNFVTSNLWGNSKWEGIYLDSIERYKNGPCKDQPKNNCHFDSRNLTLNKGKLIESITANGKYWLFYKEQLWGGSKPEGIELKTVKRYKEGPCKHAVNTNNICTFDTRTVTKQNGNIVEIVTRGNKYWKFIFEGENTNKVKEKQEGTVQELTPGVSCHTCKIEDLTFHQTIGEQKFKSLTSHRDFTKIKNTLNNNDNERQLFKDNAWLHTFIEYYKIKYNKYPQIDWINIHNYPDQTNYGNAGTDTDLAINEATQQIKSIKRYLSYKGMQSKPIWITEFSLLGETCGPQYDSNQNANQNAEYFEDCNEKATTLPYNQVEYMEKIIKVYKQEGITRWFWFLGGEDRSYRGKNNSSDIFYGWDKTQNKEALNKLGQKYLDLYKQ